MIGIALEGGGAKGSYQVGALKALKECGIKPQMIAGTSIGSVNAALICQGNYKKMENIWLNSTTDIFGLDSTLILKLKNHTFKFVDFKTLIEDLKEILLNKGIDTDKILNLLNEYIDEDKVRNSKIKFGLVTVRLKGMAPLELTIDDIPKGKLTEYILASCYLPFFSFQKIIDDNYYLDGGFYNILPITLLEKSGCNKIYAIKVQGTGINQKKVNKNTEIIEIKTNENLGLSIIFDKESNLRNMKMGYYDTLKSLIKLDGNKYYFKNRSDKYYDKIIKNVNKITLSTLKLKHNTLNNKDLTIKVIEYLMDKTNMNPYQVYNIKSIIKDLKNDKKIKGIYKDFIDSSKLL